MKKAASRKITAAAFGRILKFATRHMAFDQAEAVANTHEPGGDGGDRSDGERKNATNGGRQRRPNCGGGGICPHMFVWC